MKIIELIDILKTYPEDKMVVVEGYEADFDDPNIHEGIAELNHRDKEPYCGKHRDLYYQDEEEKKLGVSVLVIGR